MSYAQVPNLVYVNANEAANSSSTFVLFIAILSCIVVLVVLYKRKDVLKDPARDAAPVESTRDKLGKVLPVLKEAESGDCVGTVYKKRGFCKNANGDILDGSENKCGKGKISWALDMKDSGYKAEFGPLGKCPNFEELRDCEVPCPRPCEGDTWKTGQCVRKDANGKVTVLDGTKGKCGDGILDRQLDTTAADYKPAVGSGKCIMKKEGACFVACPKPEPPKCSYVTAGWQKNDLGCVTSKTPASDGSYTSVSCGQSGWRQEYKASTLNTEKCDALTRWLSCKAPPCPVDCVGSWSGWSACTLPAGEVCGITKTKQTYRVTQEKNSTGKACPNNWYDGQEDEKTCGQSQSVLCCTKGNWENVGEPLSTGKQKQKRTVVGCDPTTTPKAREIDSCYKGPWGDKGCTGTDGKRKETRTVKGARCDYGTKNEKLVEDLTNCCKQKGGWTDSTVCGSNGKKTQTQSTEGNCPSSVKTRSVDCEYIGGWSKSGSCGSDGKQKYTRNTKNSSATTSKSEDCKYVGDWVKDGDCTNAKQKYTRIVKNGNESTTKEETCCKPGPWKDWICTPEGEKWQSRNIRGCDHTKTSYKRKHGSCSYDKCQVEVRPHWCHDNHTGWFFTSNVKNLHDHGAGDTMSSFKLSGSNCRVYFYDHVNYRGSQWKNAKSVKNTPRSNAKCFNTADSDNSVSSMLVANSSKYLGPYLGYDSDSD